MRGLAKGTAQIKLSSVMYDERPTPTRSMELNMSLPGFRHGCVAFISEPRGPNGTSTRKLPIQVHEARPGQGWQEL